MSFKTVTIKKCDGEYRVPCPFGSEVGAYYTTCKSDAIDTARVMHGDAIRMVFRTVYEDWS